MDTADLASRLRALREYTGLSTRALGELAGLALSHLRPIEDGSRSRPSAETLVKIARVLGATVEWLVTGEGEGPTEKQVRASVKRAAKALGFDITSFRENQPTLPKEVRPTHKLRRPRAAVRKTQGTEGGR